MSGEPYFSGASAWSVTFWISFAGWFAYVVTLVVRERAEVEDAGTSRVLLLTTVGGLLLAFLAAYGTRAATISSWVAPLVGLTIVWSGLLFGEWARRSLGRHYHPVVAVEQGQPVVDTGPYRFIRHPIYAARLLCVAGLGVAMGNWVSLACCAIVPLFGFVFRIRVEETAMLAATGDEYATYCDHTWRLIPLLW